jgi:hypothetical protein
MLALILTLLAILVGLVALLWTGTLLAQGYIYDSPTDGLAWRAPAGAGALTLLFAIWAFIDYRIPRATDTIFTFSHEHVDEVDNFISVRKTDAGEEQRIRFTRRRQSGNQPQFVDDKGETWARSRSGMMVAMIVEEKKGDEVVQTRFNAEMKDGKFAPQEARGAGQTLRYVEEGGHRYIFETQLGKIFSKRSSLLLGNIVLNLVHFATWFAVLWLLMRFTWPHALGFACVCWVVVTLALVPYMLARSRDAADKRPKPAVALLATPPAAQPGWSV